MRLCCALRFFRLRVEKKVFKVSTKREAKKVKQELCSVHTTVTSLLFGTCFQAANASKQSQA
jgi:hypothetical protein